MKSRPAAVLRTAALAAAITFGLFQPPVLATGEQGPPAFPHDSQMLEKLHDRRFNEIGSASEDRLSLAAVVQGFNHYGCTLRGAKFEILSLPRYMQYWSDPQDRLMLGFVKLHPLWLGTAQATSARGGCESKWAQTTMRNLIALLDERTRPGAAPSPSSPPKSVVPTPAPLGPRFMRAFPLSFDQAFMHVFTRQSRGRGNPGTAEALRTQVSAIPGNWPVLRCLYAIEGGHISTGYWHTNKPPALTSALEASLPAGHPVFGIGPPRSECPAEPERQVPRS